MKRHLSPVLVAIYLLIAAVPWVQAEQQSFRKLLHTEGTAEVSGRNDSARVRIAVVTTGRKLEAASTENASRTEAVLSAVRRLGVENLKLETAGYRVNPQRDYKARPPKIHGYEVHNGIEATLEKLSPERLSAGVSRVIGAALDAGANNVSHIQFYIREREPLEKEALTRATQEAMARAGTLARAAGVRLKEIVSLRTQPGPSPPAPRLMRAAAMNAEAGSMAPPVEAGESVVRAQVSISYEIE